MPPRVRSYQPAANSDSKHSEVMEANINGPLLKQHHLVRCQKPVRIWKVGLRGRNKDTDRLYDWRIEGNYGVDGNWDTLYASPSNPGKSWYIYTNIIRNS